MLSAEELIRLPRLQPHPREGGWHRETYRSSLQLPAEALAPHYRSALREHGHLLSADAADVFRAASRGQR